MPGYGYSMGKKENKIYENDTNKKPMNIAKKTKKSGKKVNLMPKTVKHYFRDGTEHKRERTQDVMSYILEKHMVKTASVCFILKS